MVKFNRRNVERFKYFVLEWVAAVALLLGILAPFIITGYVFGGVGVIILAIACAVAVPGMVLITWLTEPEWEDSDV